MSKCKIEAFFLLKKLSTFCLLFLMFSSDNHLFNHFFFFKFDHTISVILNIYYTIELIYKNDTIRIIFQNINEKLKSVFRIVIKKYSKI